MIYKVRLVAQGFSQIRDVNYFDTYAGVARSSSIKLILAAACALGYDIWQLDVETAYLNAPLDEEVYISLPTGCNELLSLNIEPVLPPTNTKIQPILLKLLRSMYGLKQSGRNWHILFQLVLKKLSFTPTDDDSNIYVTFIADKPVFLAVIVDDIICCTSHSSPFFDAFVTALKSEFTISLTALFIMY